jgi:hypothetical protein
LPFISSSIHSSSPSMLLRLPFFLPIWELTDTYHFVQMVVLRYSKHLQQLHSCTASSILDYRCCGSAGPCERSGWCARTRAADLVHSANLQQLLRLRHPHPRWYYR